LIQSKEWLPLFLGSERAHILSPAGLFDQGPILARRIIIIFLVIDLIEVVVNLEFVPGPSNSVSSDNLARPTASG